MQAREGSWMRRLAKRAVRALLGTTALLVVLLGWLVAAGLSRNYLRAETRGTVPIERLARRGSALERAVSAAVADSVRQGRYTRGQEWYGARATSANGDTIRFRIYPAEDARLGGRLLRPEAHIVGGAHYIIPERRLVMHGTGVR